MGWSLQLIELLHFFQIGKDAVGFLGIDAGKRETHVNQYVVVDANLRDMLQANAFEHAFKRNFPHEHVVLAINLHHAAWDSETHGSALDALRQD
jgi:hypothetical protein